MSQVNENHVVNNVKQSKNHDNPDYNWYVYSYNQHRLLSGNEFENDAKDQLKEYMSCECFGNLKIYSRRYLVSKMGINPNSDTAWGTDMEEKFHLYQIKRVDITGVNKGEVMKIAYNNNLAELRNVDSAIPASVAKELNHKTFFYVYDYNGVNRIFGGLVDLREKAFENNILLVIEQG